MGKKGRASAYERDWAAHLADGEEKWYAGAAAYWRGQPANNAGVLAGYDDLAEKDADGSAPRGLGLHGDFRRG